MTRELADLPHPTPNPDGPHVPSEVDDPAPVPAGLSPAGDTEEEEPYDSFFDDLNQQLSRSIEQPAPDPALGSEIAEGGNARPLRSDDPVVRFVRGPKLSPHTSEVFKAVVALSGGSSQPVPGGADVPPNFLHGDSPESEEAVGEKSGSPLLPDLVVERREVEHDSARDDDTLGEGRFPWFQVFLLSYASAVTLALTWVVLTGRTFRWSDQSASTASAPSDSGPPVKSSISRINGKELPPLPAENVTTIGSPLRIGDLQITPLSVALSRIELEGAIDPAKYRGEDGESLVLRVQFTNLSKTQAFAPLELTYIRDQNSPLDRCLIATGDGRTIAAYPLAVDSEWSIVGQQTPVLPRGETVETVIASETGASGRIASEMTWRLRVRTGPFRTDVVGIRIRENEVERGANTCNSDTR
jgi:hypothetical protein